MPLQHHGNPVHPPRRVAFDERELPLVPRAGGLVAQHSRRLALDRMGSRQLADHHAAAAAGRVTQANRMAH